jgi:hypothetical protein
MEEKKYNENLARVPQHMALVPDAMSEQFQRQAGIIRDIFLYTIKKQFHTQNLFRQVVFSADDFCKEMGYSRTEMQRRMDIWTSKFKPPLIEGHECDSLLEYSLYRATKENVVFTRRTQEGNPKIVSYQILKSVEIIYDKSTNKKVKRLYSVELSPQIFNDAFVQYFVLDYNEYKSLAAKSSDTTNSYRNFYVFFAGMIAIAKSKGKYSYRTNVSRLAVVFDYEASEPRYLKKSVQRALNTIQAKLKYPFGYKFVPAENSTSKISYDIVFSFTDEIYNQFDEKLLRQFWFKIRERVFMSYKHKQKRNNNQDFTKVIREDEITPDSDVFYDFWFNPAFREEKESILNNLLQEVFPNHFNE